LNKKKIISVVGARPNFMKVAPIDRAFKKYANEAEHIIVHTGQHYDVNMSDAFFKDLDMPQPKHFLGVGSGTHAEQTAKIMLSFEKVLIEEKPDMIIVVGDVNSTIACGLTAVKLGIKVSHVEGGLRSFDRTMPEEINRIATDAICDYCFITEESALINLRKENFPEKNLFFTGNTMIDSQVYALPKAKELDLLRKYDLEDKNYVLSTIHRPSNVDDKEQLSDILDVFEFLSKERKIILPMHPRTRKNLEQFDLLQKADSIDGLRIIEPVGYLEFLALILHADFLLTDSGGIQEETTALDIPCITIRPTTERPSTVDIGTNILIQPKKAEMLKAIENMLHGNRKQGKVPPYWDGKAADRIVKIIMDKCLL
jgi:UDP-N-acetylglucosamine 2-epimerase (non-hydrolysing)